MHFSFTYRSCTFLRRRRWSCSRLFQQYYYLYLFTFCHRYLYVFVCLCLFFFHLASTWSTNGLRSKLCSCLLSTRASTYLKFCINIQKYYYLKFLQLIRASILSKAKNFFSLLKICIKAYKLFYCMKVHNKLETKKE